MYGFYPLRFTWKAVFKTIATAANPTKAMNAIKMSVVVKLDQVSMCGLVDCIYYSAFLRKGKGGLTALTGTVNRPGG